jgi:aspartyl-tRNA(Asn)/glutamyl-tRNA(Gln) amidotransferase subunit C
MIAYLEDLSCLALSDNEKTRLAGDLQKIMDNLAINLTSSQAGIVPECINPLDTVNVFREDKVYPSLDRELVLKNAPFKNDEMFIAPRTVE